MPARSVYHHLYFFQNNDVKTVLDYGAGNLRNTTFLAKYGFQVIAVDLPEQIAKLKKTSKDTAKDTANWVLMDTHELRGNVLSVDLVISNFVLTLVTDPQELEDMLSAFKNNLRAGGYLLVEVRSKEFGLERKTKLYLTPELDGLVVPLGFRRIARNFGRHTIILLYQLRS